jgi:hypothetical protein
MAAVNSDRGGGVGGKQESVEGLDALTRGSSSILPPAPDLVYTLAVRSFR